MKRKVVEIFWRDAAFVGRWQTQETAARTTTPLIRSIGILVSKDEEDTIIASSVVMGEGSVGCETLVPTAMVKKMRIIYRFDDESGAR